MATFEGTVKKLLRKNGWSKKRQGRGSHEIWTNPDATVPDISVPSTIKSRHTANSILKAAGISKLIV